MNLNCVAKLSVAIRVILGFEQERHRLPDVSLSDRLLLRESFAPSPLSACLSLKRLNALGSLC